MYKALHTRLNKEVVIKQIINSNAKLNRSETDPLKGLKHSYLPQVLDFVEKDNTAYTVMDFISGCATVTSPPLMKFNGSRRRTRKSSANDAVNEDAEAYV